MIENANCGWQGNRTRALTPCRMLCNSLFFPRAYSCIVLIRIDYLIVSGELFELPQKLRSRPDNSKEQWRDDWLTLISTFSRAKKPPQPLLLSSCPPLSGFLSPPMSLWLILSANSWLCPWSKVALLAPQCGSANNSPATFNFHIILREETHDHLNAWF